MNIIVTTHGVDGEKALIAVINLTNNAFIYTSSLVKKHCSFEELNCRGVWNVNCFECRKFKVSVGNSHIKGHVMKVLGCCSWCSSEFTCGDERCDGHNS